MRRIFEPKAPHLIELGWHHGRFLDFWSIMHILSGALLGMVAQKIGLSLTETLLIVAGIATLYEVLEIVLQISEDIENVLSDIVLTTTGGVLAWYFVSMTHLNLATVVWTSIGILVLDAILFSLGWRYYFEKKDNK